MCSFFLQQLVFQCIADKICTYFRPLSYCNAQNKGKTLIVWFLLALLCLTTFAADSINIKKWVFRIFVFRSWNVCFESWAFNLLHSHPVAWGINLQSCIWEFMPGLVFFTSISFQLSRLNLWRQFCFRKFHITKKSKLKKKLEYFGTTALYRSIL